MSPMQWAVPMTLCSTILFSAAPCAPRCNTVLQYTLYGGSVEGNQQLLLQIVLPEHSQEVESLLSPLHHHCGVGSPGQFIIDLHTHEFRGVDPFHTDATDVKRGRVCSKFPKVQDEFFCFCGAQLEDVVETPCCHSDLTSVVGLISS